MHRRPWVSTAVKGSRIPLPQNSGEHKTSETNNTTNHKNNTYPQDPSSYDSEKDYSEICRILIQKRCASMSRRFQRCEDALKQQKSILYTILFLVGLLFLLQITKK